MKGLLICLLGFIALTTQDETCQSRDTCVNQKDFLKKQKQILQLLDHIRQPSFYEEVIQTAKKVNLEKLHVEFKKPEVVAEFLTVFNQDHLPKGKIFSSYNKYHIREAKSLFKLFYHAPDFKIFYKIASWARQTLNEELFVYSFYAALAHRSDCKTFNTPPIYEILPHHFFSSDVIQKANNYKEQYHGKDVKTPRDEDGFEGYTIDSYYSGHNLKLHPDQEQVNYYLEDIGINAFFYYYNLYYPYWLGSEDLEETGTFFKRGEVFFLHVQQSAARFYLERLSNNLGALQEINWEEPFKTGYVPSLRHGNGLEFPVRPNSAHLLECNEEHLEDYLKIREISTRLRDTLDFGKLHNFKKGDEVINLRSEESLDLVGNMIEGNADSPNHEYFGSLSYHARHLLGCAPLAKHKNEIIPSAMEHDETSLRDPAYYQLYKTLNYYLYKYKNSLPAYTKKDVIFEGVSIKNIEFDKLVTHFDHFYADLSNAVYMTSEEVKDQKFRVRVKQYRLNQKPFSYRLTINSDKEHQASVRVYIGPKYDEHGNVLDINKNRINFVQFDYFPMKLNAGENIIKRHSTELFEYCDERISFRDMYEKVLLAESGKTMYKNKPDEVCFPRRVALPRGSVGGTPFQFYFIVSPYKSSNSGTSYDDDNQYPVNRMDEYALDYPFDRLMEHEELYTVPNARFHETKIYFDDQNIKSQS